MKLKRWCAVAAIATLVAAMGILAANPASATASTTVVKPSAMNGWAFADDNGNGGIGQLVSGPATPPLQTGSARLAVAATNQGYVLGTLAFSGTRLDQITTLGYSSFQPGPTLAIALQFDIRYRPTDTAYGGRLV